MRPSLNRSGPITPTNQLIGWVQKVITSGEVRTPALKRGPELESGALTTRPQMQDGTADRTD